jgi:hypothetical protein
MRRLDQSNEQSGANGTDRGDLTQQFCRAVFPAFGQQIASHLLAQCLERVELSIAELRPAKCAGFGELGQPLCWMTLRVHPLSCAGDRPTPVQSFQTIHRPGEILRECQVAAGKFLKSLEKSSYYGFCYWSNRINIQPFQLTVLPSSNIMFQALILYSHPG